MALTLEDILGFAGVAGETIGGLVGGAGDRAGGGADRALDIVGGVVEGFGALAGGAGRGIRGDESAFAAVDGGFSKPPKPGGGDLVLGAHDDGEYSGVSPGLRRIVAPPQSDPESLQWVREWCSARGLSLELANDPEMLIACCVAQAITPPPRQMVVGPQVLDLIKVSGFTRVAGLSVSRFTSTVRSYIQALVWSKLGLVYYQRNARVGGGYSSGGRKSYSKRYRR